MLVNPTSDHPELRLGNEIVSNPLVSGLIWQWYDSNLDRVILKVAFVRVRVRDLRILFEMIAGPRA